MRKNKIILIAGDPYSVNSEIISKVWNKLSNSAKRSLYLIGNFKLLNQQFKKLGYKTPTIRLENIDQIISTPKLKVLNIPFEYIGPFKFSPKKTKKYVLNSFKLGHHLAMTNQVKGLINCPIDKSLLGNLKNLGVTEFLSQKNKITKGTEVMFIHNKKLSVVPITTHININKVSKNLNQKLIITKMVTLKKDFKRLFKRDPKIAILGLNPHNSEFRDASEEINVIIPAVSKLKKMGLSIKGPLPADTIFIDNYKNFDVIVGMYHDQVLTPFKTLFKYDAINITLGLKYIRVSPDHGPAKDLIAKNKSNHLSLLNCINFVNNLGK